LSTSASFGLLLHAHRAPDLLTVQCRRSTPPFHLERRQFLV
jgi:hypothetical protein